LGGIGGGHAVAAGAKIPLESYAKFIEEITRKVRDEKNRDRSNV